MIPRDATSVLGWRGAYRDAPSGGEYEIDELRELTATRAGRVCRTRFPAAHSNPASIAAGDDTARDLAAVSAMPEREADAVSFWLCAAAVMMPLAANADELVASSEREVRQSLANAWVAVEAACFRRRMAFAPRSEWEAVARRCGVPLRRVEEEQEEERQHEQQEWGGEEARPWLVPWECVAELVGDRAVELSRGMARVGDAHLIDASAAALRARVRKEVLPRALAMASAMLADDAERAWEILGPALAALRRWVREATAAAAQQRQGQAPPEATALGAALRAAPPCMTLPLRRVRAGGRTLTFKERGPIAGFLASVGVAHGAAADCVAAHCSRDSQRAGRAQAEDVARRGLSWGCAKLCSLGMCPFASWRSDEQVAESLEAAGVLAAAPAARLLAGRDRARRGAVVASCRAVMCEAHGLDAASTAYGKPDLVAAAALAPARGGPPALDSSSKTRAAAGPLAKFLTAAGRPGRPTTAPK